jgi:hypothetical protein
MRHFNSLLTLLEEKYSLEVQVDTGDFDARWLSNHLQAHGYEPLGYTRDGEFRGAENVRSFSTGRVAPHHSIAGDWRATSSAVKKLKDASDRRFFPAYVWDTLTQGSACHMPEYDAMTIAHEYCAAAVHIDEQRGSTTTVHFSADTVTNEKNVTSPTAAAVAENDTE